MPHLNSREFWTSPSLLSRLRMKRTRITRIRARMITALLGPGCSPVPPSEDGALRLPPCSQQLHDIKKMFSAARLDHPRRSRISNARSSCIATRIIQRSHPESNIFPSCSPNYSMMFSAGRVVNAMDPFALRKLRGSIAARASVVSSRERSAAKRRTTTLCFVKRARIVIFDTLEFLHLLIVS